MGREGVILGVIPTCGDMTLFFSFKLFIYFSLTLHTLYFRHSAFSINFVIFHFVKSTLPFPGSVQWAGELYRVLYLI